MKESQALEGVCKKIIFHNPDNGYTVFVLQTDDSGDQTCVGSSPNVKVGQTLQVSGTLEDNKYGSQVQCETITPILPKSKVGIMRYLSSGIIPGIGEGFAKKLVAFAGTALFKMLDKNPTELYAIKGIGKKRLDLLIKNWQDYRNAHEVMMFLQKFNIGPKRAMKIYQHYQEKTLHVLQTNPYQIYQDITGIGFPTADQIATESGIDAHATIRIIAGIQFVLEKSMQSGHCYLPISQVETQLQKVLQLTELPTISSICQEPVFHLTEEGYLYLKPAHTAERQIETSLQILHQSRSIWDNHSLEQYLTWLNQLSNITLSASQQQAIIQAIQSKVGIITGGPGVGKTTITKAILHLAQQAKLETVLCAPTGRAAKKMASCTQYPAKTIHRLLKMDPSDRKFLHNKSNPLKADLVIIDEASMIDIYLANHLLQAIDPLSNVIIIGDIDQLPSVGPGAFLKDLIQLYPAQTAALTEIFRQAKDSHIIQNAHLVNAGKMLIPNEQDKLSDFYFIAESDPQKIIEKIKFLVKNRIPSRFSLNPLTDVQILSPMHKGLLGTQSLNDTLQTLLNPTKSTHELKFKVGDKVIQTRNNYDKDAFNGDVGFVTSINTEHNELTVDYGEQLTPYLFSELDQLQLAYAISIHKSQGSEYPAVIIPIAMQHYTLLERNLLYTAITRGKQLVILIGEMKAIAMAIRNQSSKKRYTNIQSLV